MVKVMRALRGKSGLSFLVAAFPERAWAGPIDYTRMSDGQLSVGLWFVILLLLVQTGLGLVALFRYWKKYKIDGKGLKPWLVLFLVLGIIVFWTLVFFRYVRGPGARFIG